ncbi:MAG: hypothetical protein L3K09_02875 [Thermoplasmata archaeon]|nr:hypothetical protein [Thermoplasmata archaeon]
MAVKPLARLHHVSLEVTDIRRTEFYHDRFLGRLGYRRFVRDETYLGYTNGETTLWLLRGDPPRVRRKPITGEEEVVAEHLAFAVASAGEVQKIQDDLERSEVYPTFRAEEHPEFRAGYFSATWVDPDGIVLEVYFPGPARAARARRGKARAVPRRRATKR